MDPAPADSADPGAELAEARRRIAQLEAALMRRTELLERKQAELANVRASRAFKLVSLAHKAFERGFPVHSRRRAYLRFALKRAGGAAKLALSARSKRNGPPPEARHLSESTPPDEYRRWIARHEPKKAELARQRQDAKLPRPKISVVVPVFAPPLVYLDALVKSVVNQTYPEWELCCADASPTPESFERLSTWANSDARVKVVRLAGNLGIAGNTNAAAELATGDFVAFADHDDTLAEFALYEVAQAIRANPSADFLYSDEDKLDRGGARVEPNFKPDWSPDTLRSRNYVCHLTVLSRKLFADLGGVRPGFDGAQDHDLVLRAGERAARVVHIPAVLYHWRMHAQSTASDKSSKLYAFDAGKRAVAEHLARTGVDAAIDDGPTLGTYVVRPRLRTQPLVSVIIASRDHAELLAGCVRGLDEGSYANTELIVLENGSDDPATFAYYAELSKRPNARVLAWDEPFNYAAINNFGASRARGEYLLFVNNDIQAIGPDWLESLVRTCVQPGVGAVGPKLYYPDDTVQHAGVVLGMGGTPGTPGVAGHVHLNYPREAAGHQQRLTYAQNVAAVSGACLLMPASVFRQVGGFDEGFVLAFNDIDLCMKILEAGYRIVWTPASELYHLESKTRGYEDTPEKQARFKREIDLFLSKWGPALARGDPYYSRHFRLDRPDCALR